MMGLIERVIVPALVIFLLLGGSASTLLGFALVFRPEKALGFMRSMNRWVSTRRALKQAEIPRSVEVSSRKGRVWLALFLLLGGLFAIYFLVLRMELPSAALVLGVDLKRWLVGIALQTMRWFLIVGSVVAVAIAAMILFFPQGLAALEARMNKWYSTRHVLPPAGESMRFPLEIIVEASPRAAGWIIAAASFLVAAAMAILLAARIGS